jgi:hypothetical protein
MTPTEIVAWVGGAVGLAGVAWAFFKSNSLAVRLGALGVFGVFYISMLFVGWGGTEWFNATTIGVVLIAFLSRMKAPLPGKPGSEAEPASEDADADAEPTAITDGADAEPAAVTDGADAEPTAITDGADAQPLAAEPAEPSEDPDLNAKL